MTETILNEDQSKARDAFFEFLFNDDKYMIIDGPGGTGKSVLTGMISDYQDTYKKLLDVLPSPPIPIDGEAIITSTTNKACQSLTDATHKSCKTIHSALGLVVKNNFRTGEVELKLSNKPHMYENQLLFIDECSMIDNSLFSYINSMTCKCKVVLIGDRYQLPPVKIQESPIYNMGYMTCTLNQQMRAADCPDLIDWGYKLRDSVKNKENVDLEAFSDHIHWLDTDALEKFLEDKFSKPTTDTKILCYTNRGVNDYIDYIYSLRGYQNKLNPGQTVISNDVVKSSGDAIILHAEEPVFILDAHEPEIISVNIQGQSIDLLIQKVLTEVLHGDCLVKEWIDCIADYKMYKDALKYAAKQKDWISYFTLKEYLADLRPCEASTIHKAQGMTVNDVLIDLSDVGTCTSNNLFRKLLYVAYTRARNNVYLTGVLPERLGEIYV